MDEKWKQMNKKKDEGNLFITNNYVSIQTLLVHNQKVCVNWNTTCSSLKSMCQSKHHLFIFKSYVPIRKWDNMRSHILYTISTCFYLNLVFQTSYV
jgi:hypothetical protein